MGNSTTRFLIRISSETRKADLRCSPNLCLVHVTLKIFIRCPRGLDIEFLFQILSARPKEVVLLMLVTQLRMKVVIDDDRK